MTKTTVLIITRDHNPYAGVSCVIVHPLSFHDVESHAHRARREGNAGEDIRTPGGTGEYQRDAQYVRSADRTRRYREKRAVRCYCVAATDCDFGVDPVS